MKIIKKAAWYFARKEFCRRAIAEQADLGIFKKKPSPRIVCGLVLIAVSYVIGLPAAVIVSVYAASRGDALLAAVFGPLLYGLSWLLFLAGVYLAGPEYGRALSRWFARISLEKILGAEVMRAAASLPGESTNEQPDRGVMRRPAVDKNEVSDESK